MTWRSVGALAPVGSVLLGLAVTAGCTPPTNAPIAKIGIDGSSTVFKLTQAVAQEFSKQNRSVQIKVDKSGTGGGFKNKFIAFLYLAIWCTCGDDVWQDDKKKKGSAEAKELTLANTLNAFLRAETLGTEDPWYISFFQKDVELFLLVPLWIAPLATV